MVFEIYGYTAPEKAFCLKSKFTTDCVEHAFAFDFMEIADKLV
jgi:hypothetical protein